MADRDERKKRNVRDRAARSMQKATKDLPAQTLPNKVASAAKSIVTGGDTRDETRNVRDRASRNMHRTFNKGSGGGGASPDNSRNVRDRAAKNMSGLGGRMFQNMREAFASDKPQPKLANRQPRGTMPKQKKETAKKPVKDQMQQRSLSGAMSKPSKQNPVAMPKPKAAAKKQQSQTQQPRAIGKQMAQNPIDVNQYLAEKQAAPAPGRAPLFSKAKDFVGGTIEKFQGKYGRKGAPQSANQGYWEPSGIQARAQKAEGGKNPAQDIQSKQLPIRPPATGGEFGAQPKPQMQDQRGQAINIGQVTGAEKNLGDFASAEEAEAQFAKNRERLKGLRERNEQLGNNLMLRKQAAQNQVAAFQAGESDIHPNMRGYVPPGEQTKPGGGQGTGLQQFMQQADQRLQELGGKYQMADDPFERGAIRRRMDLIGDAFGEKAATTRTGMQQESATGRTEIANEGQMARAMLKGKNQMARQMQEQQFKKQNPELFTYGRGGGGQFSDMFSESNDLWNNSLQRALDISGGEFSQATPEEIQELANTLYRRQMMRFAPNADEFIQG